MDLFPVTPFDRVPNPHRSLRRLGALTVAAGLLATACGAGSEGATGEDGSTDDAGETTEASTYESPLADFLGYDYEFDEDSEQEIIDQANAAQLVIAECMRAQGFEYTPVDQAQYFSFDGAGADGLEWGSREWTEKYGFGITTQRWSQEQVGPDLLGWDPEEMAAMEAEFDEDPNNAYVESLSQDEQDAYYEALYGEMAVMSEEDFEDEESAEAIMMEPSGCEGEAWETEMGPGDNEALQQFDEMFGGELEGMWERVQADPRVVDALAEAESCVVAAGYPYFDPESSDQYEYFEEKMSGIGYDYSANGDPFEAAGVDPSTMSDEEMEAFWLELDSLDDADRALLAEIQAEEIAMAVAYLDCGAGWQGLDEVYSEVRIELEQQFLDENAEELAQFEGAGAGD